MHLCILSSAVGCTADKNAKDCHKNCSEPSIHFLLELLLVCLSSFGFSHGTYAINTDGSGRFTT